MITKEAFKALSIEQQVYEVNLYLSQGKSMIKIFSVEKLIDADESSVRKRFNRNGYKHNKELNQYLKIANEEVHKSTTNIHETIESKHKAILKEVKKNMVHKDNKNVYKLQELPSELLQIIENQQVWNQRMSEMWSWFSKQKNIVEPLELKISREQFEGEIVAKTFRVHKNILNEFLQFADDNKQYKQQDLVSKALYEFLQKYKK